MRNAIILLVIVVIIGVGAYFLYQRGQEPVEEANEGEIPTTTVATPSEEEPAEPEEPVDETQTVIGASVEERDIIAYHYGEGDTELLFVGGIHGGYEWNTVLVAYELMDYLEENPEAVPENVKVTVIPVLNPDGLFEVVGSSGRFAPASVPATQEETVPGRFNANDVDLNRNFDCDWQESATWQNRTVSGGRSAFSEPEAEAIRDYVEANDITAAVVWYSAAGGVFASNCHNGVLPETSTITDVFAEASGYPAYQSFDFYEITGDMVNWFAAENIPGISVLLTTHEDVEWEKNLLGIQALLEHYGE